MGMGNSVKNVQVNSHGTKEDEEKRNTETPLASQSLLLLLVLTNHCTTTNNPYRDALMRFSHAFGMLHSGTKSSMKFSCHLIRSDRVSMKNIRQPPQCDF